MNQTAVIVDDERLGRAEMRRLLAPFNHISIVGEAGSLTEAAELIGRVAPSVVFLDINLSGESGFDLLALIDPTVTIVFVTAFDSFAIRAFEVNALDYLLKPVNPERLKGAIERLTDPIPRDRRQASGALSPDDRILLKVRNRSVFVRVDSVSHVVAAGDYTEIHPVEGRMLLSDRSLSEWQRRLPETHFLRIHRQTIVNIDQIENIETASDRSVKIRMRNFPEPFTVSRRTIPELRRRFT